MPRVGNDRESNCGVPEWQALDRRLRSYARRRSALDAAESFDLVRAERTKLYLRHACVTMFEYVERVLGYNPHTARERMRVARALVALPRMAAELARGALTFSAVRELTRVATADTEQEWLAAAAGKIGREIEDLVAGHARGDRPEDPTQPDLLPRVVRFELPTEVYALLREARMALEAERGGEVCDADLVETLCRRLLAPGTGEVGPAYQIAYAQCRDCKRATQNGAGREVDVRPDVIEKAACDARVLGSLDAAAPERTTRSVTPRMRTQIFARDHHRCTVPGCRSARNLDVHHIIEQEAGGPNALWNCTLLCSGHHAALHLGLLSLSGRAPNALAFAWTGGLPDDPAGSDGVPHGTSRPDGVIEAARHMNRITSRRRRAPLEPESAESSLDRLRRFERRHRPRDESVLTILDE
jgi:hypothetical protein